MVINSDNFSEAEIIFQRLEKDKFLDRSWFLEEHRIFTIGKAAAGKDTASSDRITTHNIHIVETGSTGWRNMIIFRDYLNTRHRQSH